MKLLTTFILSTICMITVAQTTPARNWVDTEIEYKDSVGRIIKVYNSFPRGGGAFINSGGKEYSYVIFWTRIINESATPLKLMLKFPNDSFSIFHSSNSYIKIVIPSDTMTVEKIQLGDYGLTNLKSLLDTGFNKPSMLERILNPKKECLFNIVIFIHQARGTARTALVLKGQDLSYRVSIDPQSALIPCGRVDFKK